MIRADRVGRGSIIESQIVLRDLLRLGVSVFTRDQGDLKLDSAMDELISAATLAVARHENEVRSDKAKALRQRKLKAGEPMGRVPYGLKRDGKRNVADKERAPIVRAAFKLRLQGKGYDAIGRHLTSIAPPHAFMNGKSHTVHWTATRVQLLLLQRAYVGSIIDEATFARAQKVAGLLTNVRLRDRRRRYPWPLAGTVRCYCGRMLKGLACGVEPWRYRYYACNARWNHQDKMRLVRAERLEEQFTELLHRLRALPKLVERYSRRAAAPIAPRTLEESIRNLRAKLSDVARRRDAAWELHVDGKVRSDDVQERLDRLGQQRDDLQARVADAQEQLAIAKKSAGRVRDVEALLRRAAQIFQKANVGEQNQIARAVSIELGGLRADEGGRLRVSASDGQR
jgi:hypothetical protein